MITAGTEQRIVTGSETAQLLDFLQQIQQQIYVAEQARELPVWTREPGQFVNGQVVEQEQPRRQLPSGSRNTP